MKKFLLFFFIFLIVFSSIALAGNFCSAENSSSCKIDDGKITLNPIETDHFMSQTLDQVCIIEFYSPKCPHCNAVKPFIDNLIEKYNSSVRFTRYDVTKPENIALYNQLCSKRGYDGKSIPLIGINDKILVGETQIKKELESEIKHGMAMEEKLCPLGGKNTCHLDNQSSEKIGKDSLIPSLHDIKFINILPIIFLAGLSDGINPCAFVILIFVMVFLQQISGSKKKILKVTLTYIITILLTNILLGILYFTISVKIGFPEIIRILVIIISIIAGVINLKDFFWYGKGVSLGIPKSTKRFLMDLIHKASVPAAFILGASVAILEAPCSVPIYLAVIEVLKGEGRTLVQVFPYILIYNLMFILPLLILSFAVYKGYSAKLFEQKGLNAKRYMKLAIGIILIMLAAALTFGWF